MAGVAEAVNSQLGGQQIFEDSLEVEFGVAGGVELTDVGDGIEPVDSDDEQEEGDRENHCHAMEAGKGECAGDRAEDEGPKDAGEDADAEQAGVVLRDADGRAVRRAVGRGWIGGTR